jgi:2'-5' RNA ligase
VREGKTRRPKKPKFKKERPPDQYAVDTGWRLFIALPMPEAVQQQIAAITAGLSERDWPVRWVAAESAHLTLQFLGETPPERAELLRLGLGQAIARHAPFSLFTGDLGVFPDLHRPRVLWLGLNGDTDQLAALHRDIGRQLQELEFEVEADTRRFHPHITLGRVRDEAPASLGAEIARAFDSPEVRDLVLNKPQRIEAGEVLLVRSFLERGGARHEPVARYPLRG